MLCAYVPARAHLTKQQVTVAYLTLKVNWRFKFEVDGNVPLMVGIFTDFKVVDPGVITSKKTHPSDIYTVLS